MSELMDFWGASREVFGTLRGVKHGENGGWTPVGDILARLRNGAFWPTIQEMKEKVWQVEPEKPEEPEEPEASDE